MPSSLNKAALVIAVFSRFLSASSMPLPSDSHDSVDSICSEKEGFPFCITLHLLDRDDEKGILSSWLASEQLVLTDTPQRALVKTYDKKRAFGSRLAISPQGPMTVLIEDDDCSRYHNIPYCAGYAIEGDTTKEPAPAVVQELFMRLTDKMDRIYAATWQEEKKVITWTLTEGASAVAVLLVFTACVFTFNAHLRYRQEKSKEAISFGKKSSDSTGLTGHTL